MNITTPEQALAFIGGNYDAIFQHSDRLNTRIKLSVHDLLTAFAEWDFAASLKPVEAEPTAMSLLNEISLMWHADSIAIACSNGEGDTTQAFDALMQRVEEFTLPARVAASRPSLALVVQSQWISVDEQLPELHCAVALLNDDKWMNTGGDFEINWQAVGWLCEFGSKFWHVIGAGRGMTLDSVTHWMPLPPAPGEVSVPVVQSQTDEQILAEFAKRPGDKRGQALLRELLTALDFMPEKRLVAGELEAEGSFCALGVVGQVRGLNLATIDTYDVESLGPKFNISEALAREIMWINDESVTSHEWVRTGDPYPNEWKRVDVVNGAERRWIIVRDWVAAHLAPPTPAPGKQEGET